MSWKRFNIFLNKEINSNALKLLQLLNRLAITKDKLFAFDFGYLSKGENALKRRIVLCKNVLSQEKYLGNNIKRKFQFSRMLD